MSGKVKRPTKTKYLATIQELLNASSKQQVKELVDAIEKGIKTDQIRQAALGDRYKAHKAEIKHIQKDWYDKKTNQWQGASPEKSLRKSMVSALKVLLEQDGDKKPDIDFWWVPNVASIKKAEFVPLKGPKQLTVLLLSPPPQAAAKKRGSKARGKK